MMLFLLLELSVFTLLLRSMRNFAPPYLLILYYLFIGGESALLWEVIRLNIYGTGIRWMLVLAAAAASTIVPLLSIMFKKSFARG